MKQYLISKLKEKNFAFTDVCDIQAEASNRKFFRISRDGGDSLVAMVFPEKSPVEIAKVIKMTASYQEFGLNVPSIEEYLDPRILLQQDLGDDLLQKVLLNLKHNAAITQDLIKDVAGILLRLKQIPWRHTSAVLDNSRMKWEMDYFVTHFAANFFNFGDDSEALEELRNRLYNIVDAVGPNDTFAHRDFHSRNMLVHQDKIWLVDFQDSLIAPAFYDLASFAYDAYLDVRELHSCLLESLKSDGLYIDEEQLFLTAFQRNIKALGTFGFQVSQRNHLMYRDFIPLTVEHITHNPLYNKFFAEFNVFDRLDL